MSLAQLFGRNFDQVGAAHAEIESLIANCAMGMNVYLVHEWPALPAKLIRDESLNVANNCFPGWFKRTRTYDARRTIGIKSNEVAISG